MIFNKRSRKWIDVSAWQRIMKAGVFEPMDLYGLLLQNPDIEGVIARFINNNGAHDPYYPTYYDMTVNAGRKIAGYGWPTPDVGVSEYRDAMCGRVPKLIMHDWERDFDMDAYNPLGDKVLHARLAAKRWKELNEAFPKSQHLMYTGVSWWNDHVDHSEFIRLAGEGLPFLLAEYPYVEYPGDVWAEAQHWDMLTDYQYKTRPAYLRGVNTVGWQFSSKGTLDGYKGDLDLDVIHPWFVGEVYGASWIKKKILRLGKILQGK